MTRPIARRHFLKSAAALGPALGLVELAPLLPLTPARAADAVVTPDLIRYGPAIEPLVRLIEETPIDECPDMLVGQLHAGLPYRRFLAALFLAALRGPRAIAHSVFAIHSAHQLGLDGPAEGRLLPLFWALNNYKYWSAWHAKDPSRLRPFQGRIPSPARAEAEFHAAMDRVDPEAAEASLLALARGQGAHRVIGLLWAYGAKDCVDAGHNAIGVANTWRALPTVGWQHAEEILRWVLSRLMSRGDRTFGPNRERVRAVAATLPADWAAGEADGGLTRELLALLRELKAEDACRLAAARLAAGRSRAGAVWDAVHVHAAEVMMRKPDDGHSLHANTGANALHYAFRMCGEPADRLLILLQALGWQCEHRRRKAEADPLWRASTLRIDELAGAPIPDDPAVAAREILAATAAQPTEAAARTFTLGRTPLGAEAFMQAARSSVLAKATENAHDVKFPVAMFEDFYLVGPEWRPHLLAASTCWLPGADRPDSPAIVKARAAAKGS